jgi:diacylglycerol kinase family enzyme
MRPDTGADRLVAGSSPAAQPAQRWLARLALLAAAAAVAVLLVFAGIRSIGLVVVGAAGVIVGLAAVWWFLTHRGPLRWVAGALALAAPSAVVVLYARAGLVWVVTLATVLWFAAAAAGRAALGSAGRVPVEYPAEPPRRPFLIMNPRSGGGKVGRFGLAESARALGAEVVLLDGPEPVDVAALARRAVADGADLIGVAGGDGTQALVADVAAGYGVPFLVISAGTRNHFALDLGLDRTDPSSCLDALTDGVELRVDLGRIGDRTFVNNASFGAYAAVVQSPAYRDDKTRTTLDLLPDLLAHHAGPRLRVRVGAVTLDDPQAVLVSNNPYASDDVAGLGRRARLDGGVLGMFAVTVGGAASAASIVRGRRSKALWIGTATEVVVEADVDALPVGIDGEAVSMPTPVRCTIQPGALRVRVPRNRPGVPPAGAVDWARLRSLAVSTRRRAGQ